MLESCLNCYAMQVVTCKSKQNHYMYSETDRRLITCTCMYYYTLLHFMYWMDHVSPPSILCTLILPLTHI